jgi:hypothetical protein
LLNAPSPEQCGVHIYFLVLTFNAVPATIRASATLVSSMPLTEAARCRALWLFLRRVFAALADHTRLYDVR